MRNKEWKWQGAYVSGGRGILGERGRKENTHGEVDIVFGDVLAFGGDRGGDRGGGVEVAELGIAAWVVGGSGVERREYGVVGIMSGSAAG